MLLFVEGRVDCVPGIILLCLASVVISQSQPPLGTDKHDPRHCSTVSRDHNQLSQQPWSQDYKP